MMKMKVAEVIRKKDRIRTIKYVLEASIVSVINEYALHCAEDEKNMF